jgi:hypothetical protein
MPNQTPLLDHFHHMLAIAINKLTKARRDKNPKTIKNAEIDLALWQGRIKEAELSPTQE